MSNKIFHSKNGIDWTAVSSTTFGNSGRGIAYSPDQELWVAVGN